jgi:hypothetical protein
VIAFYQPGKVVEGKGGDRPAVVDLSDGCFGRRNDTCWEGR